MPPISMFFTKRKRPRSISSEWICVVDPPKTPRTADPPVLIESSCCELPCCDLYGASPTRVLFDRNFSAREIRKKTRYFKLDWLQKHSWLVYCESDNKAYCHTCKFVISSGSKRRLMEPTHLQVMVSPTGILHLRSLRGMLIPHTIKNVLGCSVKRENQNRSTNSSLLLKANIVPNFLTT